MPITDIPILSMLRTRMQWHQERQRVLAENVAHADSPNYHARDLAPPNFQSPLQTASLTLARTDPGLALAMAIFMFSMAGVPPLSGFFGKLYVFLSAVQSGLWTLAIVGVLTSAGRTRAGCG